MRSSSVFAQQPIQLRAWIPAFRNRTDALGPPTHAEGDPMLSPCFVGVFEVVISYAVLEAARRADFVGTSAVGSTRRFGQSGITARRTNESFSHVKALRAAWTSTPQASSG